MPLPKVSSDISLRRWANCGVSVYISFFTYLVWFGELHFNWAALSMDEFFFERIAVNWANNNNNTNENRAMQIAWCCEHSFFVCLFYRFAKRMVRLVDGFVVYSAKRFFVVNSNRLSKWILKSIRPFVYRWWWWFRTFFFYRKHLVGIGIWPFVGWSGRVCKYLGLCAHNMLANSFFLYYIFIIILFSYFYCLNRLSRCNFFKLYKYIFWFLEKFFGWNMNWIKQQLFERKFNYCLVIWYLGYKPKGIVFDKERENIILIWIKDISYRNKFKPESHFRPGNNQMCRNSEAKSNK